MKRAILTAIIGILYLGNANAQDCLEPTEEFKSELRSMLIEGADFEKAAAVRSSNHKRLYYVAVQLEVPGASGWALFTSTTIEGFGLMYAVDDIANEFSSLLDGRRTKARASTSDPAARQARACLD